MANDLYRAAWSGVVAETRCMVKWFFEADRSNDIDPFGTAANLADGLNVWISPSLFTALPRNYRGSLVECRRINNGGGPTFRRRYNWDGFPFNPYQRQAVVAPYVSQLYRVNGRWRVHHWTVPAAWPFLSAENHISQPQRNTLATLSLALQLGFTQGGTTFTNVAYHRATNTGHTIEGTLIWTKVRQVASRRRPGFMR